MTKSSFSKASEDQLGLGVRALTTRKATHINYKLKAERLEKNKRYILYKNLSRSYQRTKILTKTFAKQCKILQFHPHIELIKINILLYIH